DAKQWCVVWLCVLGDVLRELCGKEELNREPATDSQRTQSNSLGQGGKCASTQPFVPLCPEDTRRMIVAMIDANHISQRLASLRLEMSDLRVANARYWSRKEHTALDKQASALRQQRLIEIKLELADMSKRCA